MTQSPEDLSFKAPVEGVHYLTDLYEVVGVNQIDDADTIRTALRDRTKEYTPDRQIGTAPEFGATAERMMRLLNRAREILLVPDRRSEYDSLLDEWRERGGPISADGVPILVVGGAFAPKIVGDSPAQVETGFRRLFVRLDQLPGVGSEERVTRIEQQLDRARGRAAAEDEMEYLQDNYEDALFALDMRLAVEEQQRSQLALGRDISSKDGRHWRVSGNYSQEVEEELAALRVRKIDELTALAGGGYATRLALLAGESTVSSDIMPVRDAADYALPVYYDDQAARVQELAARRQEIMRKRIANIRIFCPEAALQAEPNDKTIVGLVGREQTGWYVFPVQELPATISEQLSAGNYAEVIRSGYDVIATSLLENIEAEALVTRVLAIRAERYSQKGESDRVAD